MAKRFRKGDKVFVIGHSYYRVFGPTRIINARYGHKSKGVTYGGPFYLIDAEGHKNEWFAEKHLGTLEDLLVEINRLAAVEYEAYVHAKSLEQHCVGQHLRI